MELRIVTEPQQGATYDDLLAVAQLSEELGFGGFFRSDHYLSMGVGSGQPGPTDSWITLGAIARETTSIRLGTLMTSATFRAPGPLAICVAQVDAMSAGRVELGLGAGWYQKEHEAYGIPFGSSMSERFDRLAEQLEIVTGLWSTPESKPFSYEGKHYTLTKSPGLPKPVQRPRPPIIIGGSGAQRTPNLAALYADEYNLPFQPLNLIAERIATVSDACKRLGRDPASLVFSAEHMVCIGADEIEFSRRASAIGLSPDQLRAGSIAGTPDQAREFITRLADLGVTRTYLQLLDLRDHDHLRLVAAELLG